jgi:hypothetical protein
VVIGTGAAPEPAEKVVSPRECPPRSAGHLAQRRLVKPRTSNHLRRDSDERMLDGAELREMP